MSKGFLGAIVTAAVILVGAVLLTLIPTPVPEAPKQVSMVCGVPNPIPDWKALDTPSKDAPWDQAVIVEVPTPAKSGCLVSAFTAPGSDFLFQCRDHFGNWSESCETYTAVRYKGKVSVRIGEGRQ